MRQTVNGRLLGTTTPLSTAGALFRHKDLVLRAARTVDMRITSLDPFEKWGWVKIHGVSLLGYMEKGSGGLQKLREELESENEGIQVPSTARWWAGQGPAHASRSTGSNGHLWYWQWWERRQQPDSASRGLAWWASATRPSLSRRRSLQPCCAWGHAAPQCPAATPRCTLCGEDH